MPLTPQTQISEQFSSIHGKIMRLAALPEIRSAFAWFISHEEQLSQWQLELARIPAPPFGEQARSRWIEERFVDLGLKEVHADEVGNVFGVRPGVLGKYVALSAHIDTVFPAGTPLNVRQQGRRLYGPGVSDNGAGVTALLSIAAVVREAGLAPRFPILFIANVGEEGEGDLRGMRHIFSQSRWLESIDSNIILDGAGTDTIVAEALGSRRFEVIVRGPGGHSWSDFGAPNPIVALARAIEGFSRTPLFDAPKTTFNIGVIRGGTSVNSIPESASMRVDVRSTSTAEIERLEESLRKGLDEAIASETQVEEARHSGRPWMGLTSEVVVIGDRPGGGLPISARILEAIRAVDAHLGNVAQVQRASTDANIPLSLGREAIAIGGGGTGGGAHTLQEWFDASNRELGLKRILLTLLALAGVRQ